MSTTIAVTGSLYAVLLVVIILKIYDQCITLPLSLLLEKKKHCYDGDEKPIDESLEKKNSST